MRAHFILSETGMGLRRNLTMTVAVVVTTAVSLTFVGVAMLLNRQADAMKDYWYDRVEVSVFLCGQGSTPQTCPQGDVTPEQREQIRTRLQGLPEVQHVFYESKQEAYAHWKEQNADDPVLVDNTPVQAMPESFRVKLVDPEQFGAVTRAMTGQPGVDEVVDQKVVLDRFFRVLNFFVRSALAVGGFMLVAAVIMIATTIRLAAFSRRRETGIMRLVGASNFYIQLPFLLEGALAGLVGGLIASGGLIAIEEFLVQRVLVTGYAFTTWIGWDAIWTTVPVVIGLGVALASLAALVTLRRYLRV